MKKINRRRFIKTTAATTAGLAMTPVSAFNSGNKKFDAKGLPTRILGKTGLEVPLLGFGLGSRWMGVGDNDKSLEILEHAFNNGMYYWDTAQIYGNSQISSEELTGKLLKSRRKNVILVTKTQERNGDQARASIEQSLKRLQTDYIDIMHVHSIKSVEDAESLGEKGNVYEVLQDLKSQGVIKHIGFTGHTSAEGMKRAAELYDFEVMMIALNHKVSGGKEKFEEHAVPYAYKKGIGVVSMKVVRPRETVAGLEPSELIRYALSNDYFSIANIGIDSVKVLNENLQIAKNFTPMSESEKTDIQARLTPFFEHKNLEWMQEGYVDGTELHRFMA